MATLAPETRDSYPNEAANPTPQSSLRPQVPNRRWPMVLFVVVGVLVVAAVIASFAGPQLSNLFAGDEESQMKLYTVTTGDLLVTVVEDGNLESANNYEIKCRVEGTTTILKIVEDGSVVDVDQVLVELDSAKLEEVITQQRIAVNKAEAGKVQAEKDHAVALISKEEYEQGTFRQLLQDSDAQITISMENLRTAENTLGYTDRMFRKGYVSKLQLESQQFSVKTAQLELDSAKTAKDVLEKYTKAKMAEDLQAKIDAARTRASSEKEAYSLEMSKLSRMEEQLKYCTISAPQGGMVVYANESRSRYSSSPSAQIEEGATVRERQAILRLPDLNNMQVKVNVHESKVEDIEVTMRAFIKVQDREFQGEVVSIASQPESTSWFSASVKEYATIVKIDGKPDNLKPGMTAEVEIRIAEKKNVLTLPVSAIVQKKADFLCWVKTTQGIEQRKLRLGLTNDQVVEVIDGVGKGERVIRNPLTVVPEAQFAGTVEDSTGDRKRDFGESSGKGGFGKEAASGKGGHGKGKKFGGSADASHKGNAGDSKADTREKGAGGQGDGSGGSRRSGNLMDYDKDGDGKVSKDEAPERMRSFFDRIDGNGDGFIDEAEVSALRQGSK